MDTPSSDVAFTPRVKAVQERLGSRKGYANMENKGGWSDEVTPQLAQFLAERDSFYFGTASSDGRVLVRSAAVSASNLSTAMSWRPDLK